MATKKSISRTPNKREAAWNKEEDAVLMMYRHLSRWEKNCLHILMGSLAWGHMVPEKTDHYTWDSVRKMYPFVSPRKEVAHG